MVGLSLGLGLGLPVEGHVRFLGETALISQKGCLNK
jgi:hypothetical protein